MKTVIIGAGFAGIAAAYGLKKDFLILEKEGRPGGLCRTDVVKGFVFDYTGHFLHLRKPETAAFVMKNSKTPLKKISRKAFIYSHGVYTDYPYQVNNYGLPGDIAAENLAGFLRAKTKGAPSKESFKKWIYTTLGEGIAKNFMLPYNEKLWKYPLEKLTLEWMGRFVPSPSVDEVMQGIMPKGKSGVGYNAFFFYPEAGGIESVVKGLYGGAAQGSRLKAQVKKIDMKNRMVFYDGGKESYKSLISTMPLPSLVRLTGDKKMIKLASDLKATSVYCLNIGFKSKKKFNRHWVYVPESKYPFYRIGFPSEVVPGNAPAGCASVFTEVSFRGRPPKGIDAKIIKGLIDMGIIKDRKDIIAAHPMILKDAYVIYDKDRAHALPVLTRELEKRGIYLAGRWGRWEYSSMEDAIIEGFEAAKKAISNY
ncbi:MAG: NAD(P)-binding protein [Oligoflexia bacterium]|nr:NAD(P)-binding protein [Oligoflexia bacterium]